MARTGQQQAFVDAVVNGKQNICLQARAGTGKTTTIIDAVVDYAKAKPTHEIAICMFAKPNQIDADAKLKARGIDWKKAQAVTSHYLGFGLVRFAFKNVKVDNEKIKKIVRAQNDQDYDRFFGSICELVHLGKVEGFGFFDDAQVGDTHAWYRLAEHYNVNGFDNTTDMDHVVACAQHVYQVSIEQTDVVDFDDMILFPLVYNLTVKYAKDLMIIDEAQDTSRARRALVSKFLKRSGKLVVVGDDRQAIMGFAGASPRALEELIEENNAKVLPLTKTWRCPKAVVREAQAYVPDIEAADDAKEGTVVRQVGLPDTFAPTDAILCRNTAPLVTTAYALIRKGVACKVEGREIGTGLIKMVDRWKVTTVQAFLNKLEDFRERELQKAVAKGKPESKLAEITDRCDTLVAICDAVKGQGGKTLDDVRNFINSLFADDVKGVLTLCTYHRSKGREWERVMLFEHYTRCPSKWAKQEWEVKQEKNLAYVAITRAKDTLVYVD